MMENLTDAIALVIRLHSEGEFQSKLSFIIIEDINMLCVCCF